MVTPEDRSPTIRAILYVFLVMALVSTLLRLYVRLGIVKKSFGLDDWLMLGATVCLLSQPPDVIRYTDSYSSSVLSTFLSVLPILMLALAGIWWI